MAARATSVLATGLALTAGLLIADLRPGFAQTVEPVAAQEAEDESEILSVSLNGTPLVDTVLAMKHGDGYYLPVDILTEARVEIPASARRIDGPGAAYVRLADIPAMNVRFDAAKMDLALTLDPKGFRRQLVDTTRSDAAKVEASASGAYLNYDAIAQTIGGRSYAASQFEAGGPILGGGLQTAGIVRTGATNANSFTRLDSSYIHDLYGSMTRVKVGDAISRGGAWGRPARFGGVQIASNFALQPGYISYPTASFAGQAALPSTVDVYVNGALRYRGQVDRGPFELNQLPTLTGGGDARVVLTDPLGRQQALNVPFYVSPRLLRAGKSDYSYEGGFLRTGYGFTSGGYDTPMLAGTHRYGLTDNHTIEAHAEGTDRRQAAGTSLTSAFLGLGEFHEEVAIANGTRGTGWLAGAAFSRNTGAWTFSVRQRFQSSNFDAGGFVFSTAAAPQRSETLATVAVGLDSYGSLSLSAARVGYDGTAPARVVSANWSLPLNDRAFVNTYALGTKQERSTAVIGMTVTFMFGTSTTASVDASTRDGRVSSTLQARHSPAGDAGWAFGAAVSRGELERNSVDAMRRTSFGDFGGAIDQAARQTGGRLSASGGLAVANGKFFPTRRIDDAFGVVSVPGRAGVTVLQENRPIGKTDKDGDLFVPRLLSNYANRIAIETTDLPVDADVEKLEAAVTPRHRGIAKIEFRVEAASKVSLTVVGEDGEPIDSGIEVVRVADARVFRSGFDGEVYLEGAAGDAFEADNRAQTCRFYIPAVIEEGTVAICEAVK